MEASEARMWLGSLTFPRDRAGRARIGEEVKAAKWAMDLINRLPKDAEGNPVAPGDTVWLAYIHKGNPVRATQTDFDDAYICAGMNELEPKPEHWLGVYRTEAAALAAKQPKEGTTDEDSH